jgi:hypothetical protein
MADAFDFVSFGRQVEAAARSAFEELASLHPEGTLCAFALYSDDGGMTVCPSTNTRPHLERRLARFPDEADFYTFSPPEWSLEAKGAAPAFKDLCRQLRHHVRHLDEESDDFAAFKRDLAECCIAALERLRREEFFVRAAKGPVLLAFQASPGDADPEVEGRMISRLNEASIVERHRAWTETWD